MNFLNPGFLYLLPLISIPLIIHLLGKQKYKTVEFSTLRFLIKLEHDVIRKLKIRQIILLIVRTLLLLILILVFARPVKTSKSPGVYIAKGKTLYLVLDNSSSMSIQNQGETYFEECIKNISGLEKEIEYPFNLKIVEAVKPGKIVTFGFIERKNELFEILKKYEVLPSISNINKALLNIHKDIIEKEEASANIWIFSDFQKSNWVNSTNNSQVNKLFNTTGTRVVLFPIKENINNVAIKDLKIVDQIIEPGKIVNLTSTLVNWGKEEVEIPVSLYLENERASQILLKIPAYGEKSVSFEFVPIKAGNLSGKINIRNDNLIFDNNRYFVINIPKQINVLIVGRDHENDKFLLKALNTFSSSLFKIKYISPALMAMENLYNYDEIIFSDIDRLPTGISNLVKKFTEDGRGIILLPGTGSDPETYNKYWVQEFGLPKWKNTRESTNNNFISLGNILEKHPVFKGVWRNINDFKNYPEFYKIPGFLCDSRHLVLMNFEDSTPFIIEMTDQGHFFLIATSPGKNWTTFQLSGFFPVLLQRMLLYLANNSFQEWSYSTLDTLNFKGLETINSTDISILTPDDRRFLPNNSGQNNFNFYNTQLPGIYKIYSKSELFRKFVVNINKDEQIGEFLDEKDYKKLIKDYQGKIAVYTKQNFGQDLNLSSNKDLNIIFLFIVLIFAGVETFIGRINRKITIINKKKVIK